MHGKTKSDRNTSSLTKKLVEFHGFAEKRFCKNKMT